MEKQQLIDLGVTEEQATEMLKVLEEKTIPKSRFDEVNQEKNELKKQLADRDTQLDTLKKSAGNSEELQNKITELENANKQAKEDYEAKIYALKLDNAVDSALAAAKAKNVQAAKALIDKSTIKFENEKYSGIDEQVKKLLEGESTKFLFDTEKPVVPPIKGVEPQGGSSGAGTPPVSLADAIKARLTN